MQTAAKQN